MRSIALAVSLLAALAAAPSLAAECPSLGINVPDVTTLMASKTNPATEAWVVTPKCEVQVLSAISDSSGVSLDSETFGKAWAIERVVSLPSELTIILFLLHPLSKGVDVSSSRKLTHLSFIESGGRTMRVALPPSLKSFSVNGGLLETVDNIILPEGATTFDVSGCALTSLRNTKLPSSLKSLTLMKNKLTSIDFNLPPNLEALVLGGNPIGKLDGLVIPDTVSIFDCESCGLTAVEGVRWPSALKNVRLKNNAITSIEVSQTDAPIFGSLNYFDVTITGSNCKHAKATTFAYSSKTLCVIPDVIFNQQYPAKRFPEPKPTTLPPDMIPTSGSGSGTSSGMENSPIGSGEQDGSSFTTQSSNTPSNSTTTNGIGGDEEKPVEEDSVPSKDGESASSNSSLMIVVAAVGGLLAALIAIIGYRVFVAKQRHPGSNKYGTASSPMHNTTDPDGSIGGNYLSGHTSTQEYLSNDIRNDKSLLPYRIERSEVQLGKVIARGGFGMVYRGKYDGRDVAIKQMLPDAWRNDTMLASFMDEIRLCASLDHPKIVQFVGITWSSLRDLSVLTEFMAGGDLYDLLYQPANGPRAQDWSQPWSTMTVSNLKCKTQMALDVAEAVVYLHSFASPIIHRDLKSKNVLLDGRGNAKLSDFGISREMVVDETMTSEIGTSAWIAPEVLRGERYTEKADIYSFGVLLVELDRCCHPYEGEPILAAPQASVRDGRRGASSMQSFASKSAQIAVLVSTGRLRPSLSSDAPPLIKTLADRCLVNDPEDRLTGMEVCYELRQVLRRMKQQAGTVGFV